MKETDNLKLKLPEENDWADVGALNENFRAVVGTEGPSRERGSHAGPADAGSRRAGGRRGWERLGAARGHHGDAGGRNPGAGR